jgi:hypothetical protein
VTQVALTTKSNYGRQTTRRPAINQYIRLTLPRGDFGPRQLAPRGAALLLPLARASGTRALALTEKPQRGDTLGSRMRAAPSRGLRPEKGDRTRRLPETPTGGPGTRDLRGTENFPSCLHAHRNSGWAADPFCGRLEIRLVMRCDGQSRYAPRTCRCGLPIRSVTRGLSLSGGDKIPAGDKNFIPGGDGDPFFYRGEGSPAGSPDAGSGYFDLATEKVAGPATLLTDHATPEDSPAQPAFAAILRGEGARETPVGGDHFLMKGKGPRCASQTD